MDFFMLHTFDEHLLFHVNADPVYSPLYDKTDDFNSASADGPVACSI